MRAKRLSILVAAAVSMLATSVALASSKGRSVNQSNASSGTTTNATSIAAKEPLPLVLKDRRDGLSYEDPAQFEALKAEVNEYLELRRRGMPGDQRALHTVKCHEAEPSQAVNALCPLYTKKTNAPTRTEGRNKWRDRLNHRKLARAFRRALTEPSAMDQLSKATESELIGALKEINGVGPIRGLAEKIANEQTCGSTALSTSLGLRTEQELPDEAYRTLTVKLYEKTLRCGSDVSVVRAGYRLALLYIWANRVAEADAILAKVLDHPEGRDYRQRVAYWRVHCARKSKNSGLLSKMQEILLKESPLSLHGLLADPRVLVFNQKEPDVMFRSKLVPRLNASVAAAEILQQKNQNEIAASLLDAITAEARNAEPEFQLYLGVLLLRSGDVLREFQVVAGLFRDNPQFISRSTLEMLYPRERYDLVTAVDDKMDPYLVLSLIRQESAFNARAQSHAGAMGLMQVMPGTARRIAKVSRRQLYHPETNVRIGMKYFSRLLKKYDGDVELALAAYNAGPDRVDEWQKRYPVADKLLFMDLMPFRETREYVASIARNYYWYLKLYSGERLQPGRSTASDDKDAPKPPVFSVLPSLLNENVN